VTGGAARELHGLPPNLADKRTVAENHEVHCPHRCKCINYPKSKNFLINMFPMLSYLSHNFLVILYSITQQSS